MKMHARFLVHGDPTRSRVRKSRKELVRILNHQVAIENGLRKSFPERGHHQRPNRKIRHKVAIHHIAMDHRAAAVQSRFCFFAQPREICGKNGGCQFNRHGPRAAPSCFGENRLYAEVSSMLVQKYDSNGSPHVTTESCTVSGCSCAPAQACASRSARIRESRLERRVPEARRGRSHSNRGSRRWLKESCAARTNPLWEQ